MNIDIISSRIYLNCNKSQFTKKIPLHYTCKEGSIFYKYTFVYNGYIFILS